MKITPFFAWFDLWIGVYIDRPKRTIYVLPVPCFGLKLELPGGEIARGEFSATARIISARAFARSARELQLRLESMVAADVLSESILELVRVVGQHFEDMGLDPLDVAQAITKLSASLSVWHDAFMDAFEDEDEQGEGAP